MRQLAQSLIATTVVLFFWVSAAAADGKGALVIYTKANAPAARRKDELPLRESVSQYGITWTFEKPTPVGQFINGDYYAVGPVRILKIEPKPLWGSEVGPVINREGVREGDYEGKEARNGSMVNPPAGKSRAGYDSRIVSGRYDPTLFVHVPIDLKPGDSLVSTISRRNEEIKQFVGQHVDPLKVAAVLTCLAEAQPLDAFRPSYCDAAHSPLHLARELRRNLLLNLPRLGDTPGSLSAYAAQCQKPWLDTVEYGLTAPVENLPHYGQQLADLLGETTLLLLMNYSPEQKEPLLINEVQIGIDLYGVARAGGTWPGHGGLHSGRKLPILFAGILLDDPAMQALNQACPHVHFAEDDQTAFCPYTYKGKVYDKGWTGAKAIFTGHSLESSGFGRGKWEQGWGPVDLFPPSQWPHREGDNLPASEGYRRANTSPAWVGEALAVRLMHAEKIWQHDAFFAYVDRWMTEDDKPFVAEIKQAGFRDMTQAELGKFMRQAWVTGAKFVVPMWNKYRNHLPPASDGTQTPPSQQTWK